MAQTQIAQLKQQVAGVHERANTVLSILDTTKARVALIATIAVLGLSYLWLVNSSATAGFYLSDLETRVATLEDEYRALEIEQTALTSLEYVEERSAELELVAAGRAQYVDGASAVAFGGTE